mmetsp:Transcript_66979/g.218024  ORF Transcript_66979/g.218024 Transcript_66979/m.218024 type:complete len:336 (+) Transcript_66979:146-1153(+)
MQVVTYNIVGGTESAIVTTALPPPARVFRMPHRDHLERGRAEARDAGLSSAVRRVGPHARGVPHPLRSSMEPHRGARAALRQPLLLNVTHAAQQSLIRIDDVTKALLRLDEGVVIAIRADELPHVSLVVVQLQEPHVLSDEELPHGRVVAEQDALLVGVGHREPLGVRYDRLRVDDADFDAGALHPGHELDGPDVGLVCGRVLELVNRGEHFVHGHDRLHIPWLSRASRSGFALGSTSPPHDENRGQVSVRVQPDAIAETVLLIEELLDDFLSPESLVTSSRFVPYWRQGKQRIPERLRWDYVPENLVQRRIQLRLVSERRSDTRYALRDDVVHV